MALSEAQMDQVRAVADRVDEAWAAGTLTREAWLAAWNELGELLGDEPEGRELLYPMAEHDWLTEVGAVDP